MLTLSISLLIPTLIKLHGILWGTGLISSFLILEQFSIIMSVYLKDYSLRALYQWRLLFDFLLIITMPMYWFDTEAFIFIEATLSIFYKVASSAYRINYDMYLIQLYDENVIKDIRYVERLSMASSQIIGYLFVIALGMITSSSGVTLVPFLIMLIFSFTLQVANYVKYISKLL